MREFFSSEVFPLKKIVKQEGVEVESEKLFSPEEYLSALAEEARKFSQTKQWEKVIEIGQQIIQAGEIFARGSETPEAVALLKKEQVETGVDLEEKITDLLDSQKENYDEEERNDIFALAQELMQDKNLKKAEEVLETAIQMHKEGMVVSEKK